MKEKPNYAELEKRIDFTVLAGRLGQLTEQDNPQRKTVFTLLDKVREQILAARRTRNVSYQVLAKELTSAGLTVTFSVVSGPGTISGTSLKLTNSGTVVVAANQAGNANYSAASQVTHSITMPIGWSPREPFSPAMSRASVFTEERSSHHFLLLIFTWKPGRNRFTKSVPSTPTRSTSLISGESTIQQRALKRWKSDCSAGRIG